MEADKLIYVLDLNSLSTHKSGEFIPRYIARLNAAGYRVKLVSTLKKFLSDYEKDTPFVIIYLDTFHKDCDAGISFINCIESKIAYSVPIVFISENNDINIRLAAIRAPNQYFFCRPGQYRKLVKIIEQNTEEKTIEAPYRVLFVDDDETSLKLYSLILINSGMLVKTLSKPLDTLKILNEFQPDIVILDVMMPECSGPELAQVIKQSGHFSTLPILFLSAESNFDRQLEIICEGGDAFLEKPVNPKQLLTAIDTWVKRGRKDYKLNVELKKTLIENEFQIVTMNHHSYISVADVRGTIISVNDKFCEISGYTRGELIGQNHRMISSGMHAKSFYDDIWTTITQGHVWQGAICNRKKTGEEYWVESTIVPFLNEQGIPYKFVCARTDITALRASEERLIRSQEFSNIGTWDWDILTNKLHWSEGIWKLFGYKDTLIETTYQNFLSRLHPEDRQYVEESINGCVEHGLAYDIEHRVIWPDGSIHWLHERGDVVRNATGAPLHMLGVVQDITKRIHTEHAYKESEEKYRLQFEYSEEPMWLIVDNKFVMANKAAAKVLGYETIENLLNTHPSKLSPEYQPNDVSSYEKANSMMEIAHHKGYHRFEWIHKKNNGEEFPVDVSLTRIPYHGDYALFCVWRDISERKEIEHSLITAREESEKANLAKSQFLSNMSHELRTPMNAIMGFSQLLNLEIDPPLSESQQENVDEIRKASDHLLALINEILDLSRIDVGRIDLSIETVSTHRVIADAISLIEPLAQKRGVNILLTMNGTETTLNNLALHDQALLADQTRLMQVMLNLLGNAVKYNNEQGTITVDCIYHDESTRISIHDTGKGLTQEQQSLLFKPFERLGAEHTSVEGIGIGLVIAKKITELMGGTIGVKSQKGAGSSFWIELPNSPLTIKHQDFINEEEVLEPDIDNKVQRTVLYIEDNPANLKLVSQLIGQIQNINMLDACEPIHGIALAKKYNPDLILLDINLPGIDGFEVLKQLHKLTDHSIPIIAVSANAMLEDVEKGLAAGFDHYITKPIDIRKFLSIVESALFETQQ